MNQRLSFLYLARLLSSTNTESDHITKCQERCVMTGSRSLTGKASDREESGAEIMHVSICAGAIM